MKKIIIEVKEPLILDYRAGVSNEHVTLDYIPASRLRGAIYEALPVLGLNIAPEALFGFTGPRWTPAWPAESDGTCWVRLPKCKQEPPPHNPKDRTKSNWGLRTLAGLIERDVPTEIHMSMSRNYETRAHRDGALYAREAVSPGQHFVAYMDIDSTILPDVSFEWNVGTRHSANGRCEVKVCDANTEFNDLIGVNARADFNRYPDCVALQLLSDAILPGPQGGYLRGLNESDLGYLTLCDIKVQAAYSSSKTVAGWSGKWNLPRESAVAIQAGSVWLLKFESGDRQKWDEFIQNSRAKGLGIRTYEGYGTVTVNPPWLLRVPDAGEYDLRFRHRIQEGANPMEIPVAKSTPGLALPRQLLNEFAKHAKAKANGIRETKKRAKDASTAREWITTIARCSSVEEFKTLKEFLGNDAAGLIFHPTGPAEVVALNEGAKRDGLIFFLSVLESELKTADAPATTAQEAIA